MLSDEKNLVDYIRGNEFMMAALKAAGSRGLPDWFIGAGVVRNTVWNIQHGYTQDYAYSDLDLGYFDRANMSEDVDRTISRELRESTGLNWEVVNQAYAHMYNNAEPYTSAEDGLRHWIETATCVAATLDDQDNVRIIAPWGLEDLLDLRLRLSPCHAGKKYFEDLFIKRVSDKKWLEKWPKLQLIYPA